METTFDIPIRYWIPPTAVDFDGSARITLRPETMICKVVVTTHTGSEIAIEPFKFQGLEEVLVAVDKAVYEWCVDYGLGLAE